MTSCGLGRSSVAGSKEFGNEHSSSIKGEFLDKLSDYMLLKKGSAIWG
jgi:hypothetical protein